MRRAADRGLSSWGGLTECLHGAGEALFALGGGIGVVDVQQEGVEDAVVRQVPGVLRNVIVGVHG